LPDGNEMPSKPFKDMPPVPEHMLQMLTDEAETARMLKFLADNGNTCAFLDLLQLAMLRTVGGSLGGLLASTLSGEAKTGIRLVAMRRQGVPKGPRPVDTKAGRPMPRDQVAWAVFRELGYPALDRRLPKGALKDSSYKVADRFGVDHTEARACWQEHRKDFAEWKDIRLGALLDYAIDRRLRD